MQKQPQLELLGQRLRAIRKARGFSQEGFALEAGLARSYYSSIERGHCNVAVLNLLKIAETLGCEAGELLPSLSEVRQSRDAPLR